MHADVVVDIWVITSLRLSGWSVQNKSERKNVLCWFQVEQTGKHKSTADISVVLNVKPCKSGIEFTLPKAGSI